ncbi:Protein of unknown function DUF616 [Macleaya cordata]|uniref:TOD1/MUCI70 glycosyltransferase-like domain-containing protein n=1 Tax=Macleaya cordata TaxID=56857 RepID=A0A200PUW7_MACCD|nr:Protein of unknown function DUF616 [Macleaya cordata]
MAQYRQTCSTAASDHVSLGIRFPHKQNLRTRRSGRNDKNNCKISIGSVVVILSLVLVVTVFAYYYISRDKEFNRFDAQDDDLKNDLDFLTNVTRIKNSKVLKFGHGSVAHGRDSRYWDRDDRRRDDEYNENVSELANMEDDDNGSTDKDHGKERKGSKQFSVDNSRKKPRVKYAVDHRSVGLYNEAGRDELKLYEAEYEASLKNVGQLAQVNNNDHDEVSDGLSLGLQNEGADFDDEYDDGIDSSDGRLTENDVQSNVEGQDEDNEESSDTIEAITKDPSSHREAEDSDEALTKTSEEDTSLSDDFVKTDSKHVSVTSGRTARRSTSEKRTNLRRRPKRHKFSGSSCEMKFLNTTAQLVEPLESRKFSRFSLQYTEVDEKPSGQEQWEPRFAGHQSLKEREESFYARDQKINCGFIKGPKGSASTGFDLAEDDAKFMSSCHIAVSSCIFGNSDNLRTPYTKTVTRLSRKNVCFVMFMDEITLQTLSSEGQQPDRTGFIGLWKIVVVKNLPYTDMRRVGKIPKFLTHRLFPSARYSIWLDSKLRLQSDPLLILEYFLWRKGYEYAISNHYDRHCLWEEVAQNKKLNKFNHTIIDQQFAFYQNDGLKRFNYSDPRRLLPSNVPEGSFIVRAHTPMSNLFSCLWFNEVDRFTPRDQLSFAYTYLKLRRMNPGKPFHLNMFKDCERRAIAKLFHHRPEDKRNMPLQAMG